MEGELIAAILALAGVIGTLGGGIIRYLLNQIDARDARIEALTASLNKTNDLNAQLAERYVQITEVRPTGGGAP